jgi:hypothetical protein
VNLPDATVVYFALAIAFVAGFSERFGEDLTAMVAKKIEPPPAQAPVVGQNSIRRLGQARTADRQR